MTINTLKNNKAPDEDDLAAKLIKKNGCEKLLN